MSHWLKIHVRDLDAPVSVEISATRAGEVYARRVCPTGSGALLEPEDALTRDQLDDVRAYLDDNTPELLLALWDGQ